MPTVADVMDYLEQLAPRALAADWDNTGLLLGSPDDPADRIMTCLTLTPEVVAEAVAEPVQLIVSHHPILFRGTKNLSTQTAEGRLLRPLLRAGIAVYSPHTAWDDAPGGINDGLARRLGLTNVQPLIPASASPEFKLVVFVPDTDLNAVSEALFQAGAGRIGQYRDCSFRMTGTGTFFPTEQTNPVVGTRGQREVVSEWRLEVVVPETKLQHAVQGMRQAHSYEEPAFDVYPLKPRPAGGTGRVGELPEPLRLRDCAARLQRELSANCVQMVGDPEQKLTRIAILCGSGGKYVSEARKAGAQAFLTGEASFHDCLAAKASGLALLLPGHYASERPGIEDLAQLLSQQFPDSQAWPSRQETDVLIRV